MAIEATKMSKSLVGDEEFMCETESKIKKCDTPLICYDKSVIFYVKLVNVIAIFIWTLIIYYMGFYKLKSCYILIIPYILFSISIYNAKSLGVDVEDEMFIGKFLTIGLILAKPIINWSNGDYNKNRESFASIIITAVILIMFSIFDVWIPKKWISVYKHVRSTLQTASLTLFVFGLIEFFSFRNCN